MRSIVKEVLDAQGRRYQWFARQMGLSEMQFHHIEAGRTEAPPGYNERAAQVLGIPLRLLLEDDDREPVAS